MGKVILVASGKGGTGKTFFVSNMGVVLAERGHKVLLVDMDMGFRNLDIALGMEDRVIYDIVDVINGICKIKQAIIRDRRFTNLYMMSAAQNVEKGQITEANLKVLCEKLCSKFDFVILDCPTGVGEGTMLAASIADQGVIITTPDFAAVRDADMLDRILIERKLTNRSYVVNKINAQLMEEGLIPGLEQMGEILRPKLAGTIIFDNNVIVATNNGLPIVEKKGTYIEKNFNNIIDRIIV